MFKVPITIVNGFLGAGKTTIILNVLESLQKQTTVDNAPKVVWLKNEFGVNEVDSVLAGQSAVSSVKEILNGCICCTLVGKLGEAVKEILQSTPCDRIIIETSGSAYPAPLALEINRLANGTDGVEQQNIVLDGVVCVIDAVNFEGYEDTFTTARLQAKYTDLQVVNKSEMAGKERTDKVVDLLLDLNPETPIIYTKKGLVHPSILFGIDQRTDFTSLLDLEQNTNDVDVQHIEWVSPREQSIITESQLNEMQEFCSRNDILRVKGVIQTGNYVCSVLNWAFGSGKVTVLDSVPESALSTLSFIQSGLIQEDVNNQESKSQSYMLCSRLTVFGVNINAGMIPRKIANILNIPFKSKLCDCHGPNDGHKHSFEYSVIPVNRRLVSNNNGVVTIVHNSHQH